MQKNEAIEKLEKEAREKNYKVEFSEEFQKEKSVTPTVRFTRRPTMGDKMRAEEIARATYNVEEPSFTQVALANISLLATFDGETKNLKQLEEMDSDFLLHIFTKFGTAVSETQN